MRLSPLHTLTLTCTATETMYILYNHTGGPSIQGGGMANGEMFRVGQWKSATKKVYQYCCNRNGQMMNRDF